MNILESISLLNESLSIPAIIIFFGVALILTIKTRFLQFRGVGRFLTIVRGNNSQFEIAEQNKNNSMNAFQALFTAMATTIGMGNMVGPTIAIFTGGPGALFWLVFYMFFASVVKYVEVCFAIDTRIKTENGHIIGGPMQYLKAVHSFIASCYMWVMAFLFVCWSALQSNTLAAIYAQEGIPEWIIGAFLALIVLIGLQGGAQRVGAVASKLVPFMFILYVTFVLLILFKDYTLFMQAVSLVFASVFSAKAASGAFVGIGFLSAVRAGAYQGIYISEAGIGTSSIPHAMTDAKKASDQGILALYSVSADALISVMSGMIVLVTGVWMFGDFRSTLIYEAFKIHTPGVGQIVLLMAISLFVLTTVIGNSFNGVQTYASITHYKYMRWYIAFTVMCIFLGSMINVRLAWAIMELLLTMVAIPNVLGVLYLAFKKPHVIKM